MSFNRIPWSLDHGPSGNHFRKIKLRSVLLVVGLVGSILGLEGCSDTKINQSKSPIRNPNGLDSEGISRNIGGNGGESDGDYPTEEGEANLGDKGPIGKKPNSPPVLKLNTEEHALEEIGKGETQIEKVCERNKSRTNSVIRAFCQDKKRPTSLLDLQQSLGVDPANFQGFAATAHSSSLIARFVSAINPRVINFVTNRAAGGNAASFVTTGFARGEQIVEVIASNPEDSSLEFFIVTFSQACNSRPNGCNFGDLLTPSIETDWTGVSLYQDEDLKNTVFDCRQCHQPEGLSAPKKLLMQELTNPWNHWIQTGNANNVLLSDYQAAHGTTETYAGIPGANMRNSAPAALERFIRANTPNGGNLPSLFDSRTIARELSQTPGNSATWNSIFERSVRGEIIAVPYYDLRITDDTLLAKFTKQYTDFREGRIQASAMEDHRKVLKQEPKELAAMGFGVPSDLSPDKILTMACAQCHNAKLDQTISRAKFDVNLSAMRNAKKEIDVAIRRLSLGYSYAKRKSQGIYIEGKESKEVTDDVMDHTETMPPPRFKRLTDSQIDTLIKYLNEKKAQLPN